METVTLLENFFLLAVTVTAMSGNQLLKAELILADGNCSFGQWKPFSFIVSYIVQGVCWKGTLHKVLEDQGRKI